MNTYKQNTTAHNFPIYKWAFRVSGIKDEVSFLKAKYREVMACFQKISDPEFGIKFSVEFSAVDSQRDVLVPFPIQLQCKRVLFWTNANPINGNLHF